MKIATWNINSIKARLDHVKRWLGEEEPDVLMLQELKGTAFPEDVINGLGYQAVYQNQKSYNGVATLVKDHAFEVVNKALPGDDGDSEARYMEIHLTALDWRLINIYAPNGNPIDTGKFDYKLAWMDRLIAHVKDLRQDEVPVLVGGDYNIIPTAKDVYDVADFQNDAQYDIKSRQKYRTMINMGFTDAFRAVSSAGQQYTFWDYQGGAWETNRGMRIDHFLLSPMLADRLKNCQIDKEPRGWTRPSDHVPVIVELET